MFQIAHIVPSLILLAGLVDDLKTQKVHNWLVLTAIGVAVISTFFLFGIEGLKDGLLGAAMALGLTLPMVLVGMLGGGDMKLMVAFGLSTEPTTVLWVIIYSFFWGALLGVVRAITQKEGLILLKNTFSLLTGKPKEEIKYHKIPYTVALFFGWLTQLTMVSTGASL